MDLEKKINVGDDAPDFTLRDQHNQEFTLSDLKGKNVLLSFHPLAWTGVCAKQMKSLEDYKAVFDKSNTVAVGVSVDTIPSKHAWAKELGIEQTRLLSDFWPHGEVASKYGIFLEEKGISGRVNIIVDENQKIVFFKIYDIPQLPDIEEIYDFLKP
ncbi:MAG: peroxiredoxin [Candidatus Aminicenantes bacterium]|jgi:peroxiredoxin